MLAPSFPLHLLQESERDFLSAQTPLAPMCSLQELRQVEEVLRLQDQRIKLHMGTEEPGSPLLSRLKAVHGEDTARCAKSMEL